MFSQEEKYTIFLFTNVSADRYQFITSLFTFLYISLVYLTSLIHQTRWHLIMMKLLPIMVIDARDPASSQASSGSRPCSTGVDFGCPNHWKIPCFDEVIPSEIVQPAGRITSIVQSKFEVRRLILYSWTWVVIDIAGYRHWHNMAIVIPWKGNFCIAAECCENGALLTCFSWQCQRGLTHLCEAYWKAMVQEADCWICLAIDASTCEFIDFGNWGLEVQDELIRDLREIPMGSQVDTVIH